MPCISDIPDFCPDEPTDVTDESGQVEREHMLEQDSEGNDEEALDFKGAVKDELDQFKEDHVDDDPENDKEPDKKTVTYPTSHTTQIGATRVRAAPALNETVLDINDSSSESDSSSPSESN